VQGDSVIPNFSYLSYNFDRARIRPCANSGTDLLQAPYECTLLPAQQISAVADVILRGPLTIACVYVFIAPEGVRQDLKRFARTNFGPSPFCLRAASQNSSFAPN